MGIFTFLLLPLVIVGCSNAVNLTDGLDGLATGCTITTAMAYAIFAYLAGHQVAADHLDRMTTAGNRASPCLPVRAS